MCILNIKLPLCLDGNYLVDIRRSNNNVKCLTNGYTHNTRVL